MSPTPDFSDEFRVELVGPNNRLVADSDNIVGLDPRPEHTAKSEVTATVSPDTDALNRVFDDFELYHAPPGGSDTLFMRGPVKKVSRNPEDSELTVEAYGGAHHLDNADAGLKTFADTPTWLAATQVWSNAAADGDLEGTA
jgi:hypothetical protein